MKYLGIDFGTKKIGLATGDDESGFAFPLSVVENKDESKILTEIKKIIQTENIDEIILGKSLNQQGLENEVQKNIQDFKDKLEREVGLPVHFQNELFSSHESVRFNMAKTNTDAQAAAIILQRYLDRKGARL